MGGGIEKLTLKRELNLHLNREHICVSTNDVYCWSIQKFQPADTHSRDREQSKTRFVIYKKKQQRTLTSHTREIYADG